MSPEQPDPRPPGQVIARPPLFRPESLRARQLVWLGRHTLSLGFPAWMLSFTSSVLLIAVAGLVTYGTYARRVELHGLILPTSGLMQMSSSAAGRVDAVYVKDGDTVTSGMLLSVVNSDVSTHTGNAQEEILQALTAQRAVLVYQIARKVSLRGQQEAEIQRKILNLQEQIGQMAVQITTKDEFVHTLAADLAMYTRFVQNGIGNLNQRLVQQGSWMRATDELEELRSRRLQLEARLVEAQSQQASTPLQIDNEIDAMRSKIYDLDQQVANAEARRSLEIRAPGSGTVTAVAIHPGQLVASGARMLTIVPDKEGIQAELLAPSTSIGFIRRGQRVLLRYSAFPYQKFGQYWGTVTNVSLVALQPEELKALVPAVPSAEQSHTFYRVIVVPDRPDVTAYGRSEPLQPSMQVDARVLLESRRISEWILEPLYGLRGPKTQAEDPMSTGGRQA